MKNIRLTDLVKGATEVNLRYTATLLNLGKEYLRAIGDVVTKDEAAQPPDATAGAGPPAQQPQPKRAPLIVAGRRGETANAAFAVNNTSGMDGTVSLQAVGEFPGAKVRIDPPVLSLKNGENAIVRVLAEFGADAAVDKDMPGAVFIPELGMQVAEFVVRRLPEVAPAAKRAKATAGKTRARGKPN